MSVSEALRAKTLSIADPVQIKKITDSIDMPVKRFDP
jgi:hypothetical protein